MSPHRLQRQSNYARSHCIISFTESCCRVACVQPNVGRFTNFNCLFCVYCVVYIALCIQMPASSYIHIYVCEERKHRPQSRNRGQLNRCYLTAAVCPAWCMGRRYDRDFAYTVWAKTSVPVMTITLWSDKKKVWDGM